MSSPIHCIEEFSLHPKDDSCKPCQRIRNSKRKRWRTKINTAGKVERLLKKILVPADEVNPLFCKVNSVVSSNGSQRLLWL